MQIKFDTKVQYIKYKVLSEVARHAYKGDLNENLLNLIDHRVKVKNISCSAKSVILCYVSISISVKYR